VRDHHRIPLTAKVGHPLLDTLPLIPKDHPEAKCMVRMDQGCKLPLNQTSKEKREAPTRRLTQHTRRSPLQDTANTIFQATFLSTKKAIEHGIANSAAIFILNIGIHKLCGLREAVVPRPEISSTST
jgi:hypothetical protein